MERWEDALDDGFLDDVDGFADSFVFGADGRFPVRASGTRPNTRDFPLNTVCLLRFGTFVCSGTLIAPRVVLTAKHCLAHPSAAVSITVTPAADASAATAALQRPFGSQVVPSASYRVHPTLDYGVLILPRAFPHRRFMLLQPRTARMSLTLLSLAGYPVDKPVGTMWAHSENILRVTPTTLEYTIDTFGGQSGGPVWLLGNDGWRVLLGVHHGFVPPAPPTANWATRITCDVIDQIRTWCRAAGVRGPMVDSAYGPACTRGARLSDSGP